MGRHRSQGPGWTAARVTGGTPGIEEPRAACWGPPGPARVREPPRLAARGPAAAPTWSRGSGTREGHRRGAAAQGGSDASGTGSRPPGCAPGGSACRSGPPERAGPAGHGRSRRTVPPGHDRTHRPRGGCEPEARRNRVTRPCRSAAGRVRVGTGPRRVRAAGVDSRPSSLLHRESLAGERGRRWRAAARRRRRSPPRRRRPRIGPGLGGPRVGWSTARRACGGIAGIAQGGNPVTDPVGHVGSDSLEHGSGQRLGTRGDRGGAGLGCRGGGGEHRGKRVGQRRRTRRGRLRRPTGEDGMSRAGHLRGDGPSAPGSSSHRLPGRRDRSRLVAAGRLRLRRDRPVPGRDTRQCRTRRGFVGRCAAAL